MTSSHEALPDTRVHKHIAAKARPFDLKLKEVWRYRDLIWLFTRKDFVITYKQTILGPLWLFLRPFITSIMYMFVFGGIAGISTDGVPKILYYLFSYSAWSLFAECVTSCAETFTANAAVLGKVYFPRLVMPVSAVLSAFLRFLIEMLLSLAFFVYYLAKGEITTDPALWGLIPAALLMMALLGFGCGIIASALTTKYRDLSILIKFGVQLWMYATPVVYPLSAVSGRMRTVLMLNPVTAPMEMMRLGLWGQGTVSVPQVMVSLAISVMIALGGILLFNRVERTFTDTV